MKRSERPGALIPVPILLAGYRTGFFPMGDAEGDVRWYSPDPRGVLPLDGFHVSRRLARVVRSGRFAIQIDRRFDAVIEACASRHDDGDWITQEILDSYCELHRAGFAHSVEAWQEGQLVGGLYGVSLAGAFFGESMFHRVSDASKVALCALVDRLRARGYRLLDIQWVTPHLERMGAIEIPRWQYLEHLGAAMRTSCRFVD